MVVGTALHLLRGQIPGFDAVYEMIALFGLGGTAILLAAFAVSLLLSTWGSFRYQ
jgi:hypothetical protein